LISDLQIKDEYNQWGWNIAQAYFE